MARERHVTLRVLGELRTFSHPSDVALCDLFAVA